MLSINIGWGLGVLLGIMVAGPVSGTKNKTEYFRISLSTKYVQRAERDAWRLSLNQTNELRNDKPSLISWRSQKDWTDLYCSSSFLVLNQIKLYISALWLYINIRKQKMFSVSNRERNIGNFSRIEHSFDNRLQILWQSLFKVTYDWHQICLLPKHNIRVGRVKLVSKWPFKR